MILKKVQRTYLLTDRSVPSPSELPWGDEECDAFVAILDPEALTDDLARELADGLARIRVGWVETLGPKSEFLHDLVDRASVAIGRQRQVGDGNPMTAWHEDVCRVDKMIEWIELGLGASDYKLIIVVDRKSSVSLIADKLREQ